MKSKVFIICVIAVSIAGICCFAADFVGSFKNTDIGNILGSEQSERIEKSKEIITDFEKISKNLPEIKNNDVFSDYTESTDETDVISEEQGE